MTDVTDHDTLIRLESKIDNISECLSGMDTWQKSIDSRLRAVELQTGLNTGGISVLQRDMEAFKTKSNWMDVFLAFGTLVGTIIGSIFGKSS